MSKEKSFYYLILSLIDTMVTQMEQAVCFDWGSLMSLLRHIVGIIRYQNLLLHCFSLKDIQTSHVYLEAKHCALFSCET